MAVAVQQVLQELSDLVPVVPPRVSEVLEAGEALQARMAEVRDRIEEVPPRCERITEDLVAVLQEAHDREQEDGERVKELVEAYEGLRLQLEKAAEDGRERIDKAGTAARDALADLQETVEAQDHLSRYEARQLTATQRYGQLMDNRTSVLKTLYHLLRQRQQEMVSTLEAAQASVQAACGELAGRIQDLEEDAARQLERLESRTRRAIDSTGLGYEQGDGKVGAASELALDGLRRVLGGDGMVPDLMGLPALVQSVVDRAASASELAAAHATVQQEAREMFEPLFEGVSVLLQPVDVALGAVRAAASLVGLGQD
jgi:hypothetical protein